MCSPEMASIMTSRLGKTASLRISSQMPSRSSAGGIGSELKASTDLRELRCLVDHVYRTPGLSDHERRGKTGDSAADNKKRYSDAVEDGAAVLGNQDRPNLSDVGRFHNRHPFPALPFPCKAGA